MRKRERGEERERERESKEQQYQEGLVDNLPGEVKSSLLIGLVSDLTNHSN